ncbi:hypothetical protein RFI_08673 [Reticulomyxa filosa]|uniref:Uncharacterized protein n=1 Tax=Reticulomyxa filosa TaxID=46433 RepID=X6NRB7_RETFI|nr:hypothetical protein RFI_08673 [Reticulomyxa filosa]|eukprot:ETO28458.1 hypothetical protein RFI_08673 [Reticulomyxa filosa]
MLCFFEGLVWTVVAVYAFVLTDWTVVILALLILPFSISGFKGAQLLRASYLRIYLFYLCLEALVILVLASISGVYAALAIWGAWLCCLLYAAFLVLRLAKAVEKVDISMAKSAVAH